MATPSVFEPPPSFLKAGGSIHFKIRFHKHCFILAEELYHASEPNKVTPQIGDMRMRRLYGAILFLAFALESFINEIIFDYFVDDRERIEKWSTIDKWLFVPKLQNKPGFDRGKEPFQTIKNIFKYRDLFAHFKPQMKNINSCDYTLMRKVNHEMVRHFYNKGIDAMKTMCGWFQIQDACWLGVKEL